jgi:threonine dehydrogenase-like Zn-dependent dehydrogenase
MAAFWPANFPHMRSLFYPAHDEIELRDVPVPKPTPGEVLFRVAACGVCGSELETFKSRSPRRTPPLIMGHEFCGTVIEATDRAEEALVGRRFVSNALVVCGDCSSCRRGDTHLCVRRQIFGMHRPGAFAEFVALPARALLPWPDELPAEAACLAEPLANGVHVNNLTRHLSIDRALVIGAGPIGLMCQQALQALRGIAVMVCDLSPGRLAVAKKLGAAKTVCTRDSDVLKEIADWTDGAGVDLSVDAAGASVTKDLSITAIRPGGAAVWIGLHDDKMELSTYAITLPEKQVLGTYSAKQSELGEAIDLMVQKKVDVTSWTEIAPIENGAEVFRRMVKPGEKDLKAVLKF